MAYFANVPLMVFYHERTFTKGYDWMNATCGQCERTFEADRTDTVFCSDVCRAQYYRKAGDVDKHSDLPNFKSKLCGNCGNLFWFNAYADRTGQREPQFCCAKCRASAWRAKQRDKKNRESDSQKQQEQWKEKFQDAFKRAYDEQQKRQRQEQQHTEQPKSGDFRDGLRIPRYWSIEEAFLWITGSRSVLPDESAVRKQWRDLNRKHHPDTNDGSMYKHLPIINAAYDYLKRTLWQKRKA